MAGKLERINSGSGGGPKNTPNPMKEQMLDGAVNMQGGGRTPNAREASRNTPKNPKS